MNISTSRVSTCFKVLQWEVTIPSLLSRLLMLFFDHNASRFFACISAEYKMVQGALIWHFLLGSGRLLQRLDRCGKCLSEEPFGHVFILSCLHWLLDHLPAIQLGF